MNKFLLFLVMLPSAIWRSMGADVEQLRAILNVRLMLDDRKPVTLMRSQKQKKDRKYGSITNFVISLAMGFFYMFPVMVVHDRIFSLTIYFFLFLSVITFMLITDFSNVLFDARDKYILFPRPVNDKTLVLARLLHVFIYLFRVVLPMALPGWIVLGIVDGWKSAVLFPLPLLLLVFMTLFLVNSVYLLVLRLAKPEKFQDVINYFQVITSVVFFAVVYLVPRAFDRSDPADLAITNFPWLKYTPPYWLASCWSWVGEPVLLAGSGIYSLLAIIVPVGCVFVLVKYLTPQFARRIGGIDVVDTGEGSGAKHTIVKDRLYQKLAYVFNKTDEARAGFMIGWLQTARSRSFRMRVYPSFAFIPIYFIYLILQNREATFSEAYAHLGETHMNLMLMYMSSFVMITALTYLCVSEQHQASWIYYSAPLAVPGRVMIGAFKALVVKFFLPFFLLISVFVVYMWGPSSIWDILLAFVNVLVFIVSIARINFRYLPFSVLEQMKQSGARVMKSMISLLIPAVLGLGHYLAVNFLVLKIIFLVLSSVFLWLVWTSYSGTTWANLTQKEAE